jgi:hypothetical protein
MARPWLEVLSALQHSHARQWQDMQQTHEEQLGSLLTVRNEGPFHDTIASSYPDHALGFSRLFLVSFVNNFS